MRLSFVQLVNCGNLLLETDEMLEGDHELYPRLRPLSSPLPLPQDCLHLLCDLLLDIGTLAPHRVHLIVARILCELALLSRGLLFLLVFEELFLFSIFITS